MLTNLRLLCTFLLLSAVALAQGTPQRQHEEIGSPIIPNASFDKIKSLAGNWEGTTAGQKVSATYSSTYKVVSAGSAVMLIQEGEGPGDEMVTIFHPDNKDLMVTHYCSAKNQPRMRMVPGTDPNVIKFEFLDATNLPNPKLPHMVGLTLKLLDGNHHVQSWTFSMNGETQTEDFDLHRKM